MDNTREGTLRRLHEVFSNPLLDRITRKQAHRSFLKIQDQMRDGELNELRSRLHKASLADDEEAVEKFTMLIDKHSLKKGYK